MNPAPRAKRQPQPATGRRPVRRTISGRQACFLFGFTRARRANTGANAVDSGLVAALAASRPVDCLDAAFALRRGVTARAFLSSAMSAGPAIDPPFDDVAYYHAIAQWLGCPFDAGPGLTALTGPARSARRLEFHLNRGRDGMLARMRIDGRQLVVMSPSADWLPRLAALIAREPKAAQRIIISVPQTLHLIGAQGYGGTEIAGRVAPLHSISSDVVANRVATAAQSVFLLGMAALTVAGLLVMPGFVAPLAIVAVTVVLLAYAASRSVALLEERTYPRRRRLRAAELPAYSVLIPLYKEDKGLSGLVHALRQLDYPPDKVDIIFLVEEHDRSTRTALAREAADLASRIVVLPPGGPQTKPRALNAGLRQARGAYVTVYDAEDRPHPKQLRIAAESFAAAANRVAGLQARLSIDHIGENWLTAMFAIEYASLFERIMPMVAGRDRLLLLGGTSNHFRREVLIEVGGWDPYNVTEDADLAVRLRRRGYALRMIDSHTAEEAPVTTSAWLKQRSRWFKGFMQTWLVHHRDPIALVRQIGWRDTALLNVYIVGALLAAVSHMVFVAQIVAAAAGVYSLFSGTHQWLIAFQIAAITFGYGANFAVGALSLGGLRSADGPLPLHIVLWFPVYWLLMSVAVMLALHDLVRKPHHWRKTAHGLGSRPTRRTQPAKPFAGQTGWNRASVQRIRTPSVRTPKTL